MKRLEGMGILREFTGRTRRKAFRYESYIRLFDDGEVVVEADREGPLESTLNLNE